MSSLVNHLFSMLRASTEIATALGFSKTRATAVGGVDTVERLYELGNFEAKWAWRYTLVLALGTPISELLVAANTSRQVTAWYAMTMSLLCFFALPIWKFSNWEDPLLLGVVAIPEKGRAALKAFGKLIAGFLAIEFGVVGLYLSIVPIAEAPQLIPYLVMSVVALITFQLAGWSKWKTVPAIVFGVVTVLFFLGGPEHARTGMRQLTREAVTGSSFPPIAPGAAEVTLTWGNPSVEIDVNCEYSSGWVTVPPDAKFVISTPPGHYHRWRTWTNREFTDAPEGGTGWAGKLDCLKFRIAAHETTGPTRATVTLIR